MDVPAKPHNVGSTSVPEISALRFTSMRFQPCASEITGANFMASSKTFSFAFCGSVRTAMFFFW